MADNTDDVVSIARELAVGNDPITAVGAETPVKLRGAIKNIYWKVTSVLGLAGRPRDPRQGDDQFGHVLSLRAEVQILRALINQVAKNQGMTQADINKLIDQTMAALQ